MKYGYLTINITDMWSKPAYNSERVNQLLFSDFVKILKEQKGFYYIEKSDNYRGWVDKRFIESSSLKYQTGFLKKKKYVITSKSLSVFDSSKFGVNPHILFYGTIVSGTKTKDKKIKISLPDEKSLLVSSSGIHAIPKICTPTEIIKDAKRFLGLPYLWGGVSSVGFDCSGFIQTILSRFGVDVPRDTKDQIKVGHEIARDEIRKGDLIFFDRHVGFALGNNKIIHSCVGGGGVQINSIDNIDIDYRQNLDETYKTTRRVF